MLLECAHGTVECPVNSCLLERLERFEFLPVGGVNRRDIHLVENITWRGANRSSLFSVGGVSDR